MLENILLILSGLAGLGGFVMIVVNLLKCVGLISDGDSDKWYKILNLGAFTAVAGLYLANVPLDWALVDSWIVLLAAFLGYFLEIFAGQVGYKLLKGTPVIGFSFESKE